MSVPFVDLKAQYRSIRVEVDNAIHEVIESSGFVLGPAVERFETEFADYLGVDYVIGINSGTTALQLALLAIGVGPGDEVIVPAHTFVATAAAVSHVGARPVLVDVLARTGNLDPSLLEGAVTPRTRAILPVHLYGQSADLDPILEFAEPRGIAVIEDACQAHGALYRGLPVGTFGIASCFSFYPGKNLGAYGEAGAVATDDPAIAARVRRLRNHGELERYRHVEIGFNARMEGIQGAVLSVKLRHLDEWNEARRMRAAAYADALGDCELELPVVEPDRDHVFHLYVVRGEDRDGLRRHLAEQDIQTGLHYPVPIHLQESYRGLGYREGAFPVAERWASRCLSLPMYAELTEAQLDRVVDAVRTGVFSTTAEANRG
jgi:dTDP-4-amino-4,6-dideoxygalactose transaminase